MKFKFFANACAIIESQDFRILTDPWFVDGAFEDAWCHFPPMISRPTDYIDVDAVYISHLHPDHFDQHFMSKLDRNKPIIVLDDERGNFLTKLLTQQQFGNLVRIRDKETVSLGPFSLTAYRPFSGHVFHAASIGNVIDSALIFDDGRHKIFNSNDNTPTLSAAIELKERHGIFDLALLNYNAAGPYPACFDNLTLNEKKSEADRITARNLDHMTKVAQILTPRAVMPFAGSFVLCGEHAQKTFYNGTITWDAAASYLREHGPSSTATITMNEMQVLDLETLQLSSRYIPIDTQALADYVENSLYARRFRFQDDPEPDMTKLRDHLVVARGNLWRRQVELSCFPEWTIAFDLGIEGWFSFPLSLESSIQWSKPAEDQPRLLCRMDIRLLSRILTRRAHWNNVEGGFHISFNRYPNEYLPDIHTIMSFFHT